jgi:hypothetical protein
MTRPWFWLNTLALLLFLGAHVSPSPIALAQDDQAPVVAEDEPVAVEEPGVVPSEERAAPEQGWSARAIEPRPINGTLAYVRHSSDAFADPDQRTSLEAKYYFVLDKLPDAGDPLQSSVPLNYQQISPSDKSAELAAFAELLQAASGKRGEASGIDARWLDYNSPKPKLLVVFRAKEPSDQVGGQPRGWLAVIRAKTEGPRLLLDKVIGRRELPSAEFDNPTAVRPRLATWDFPKDLAAKALFLNRLVAVLQQVDGRYCVDFYGANLQRDGDCRLWLMPAGDPLGKPIGICFIDIPVRKESGRVAPVSVLAVTLAATDGATRRIAFDFPLCRPAIMEQFESQAAANKRSDNKQQGPDLVKIVGEDLLDEFARRLVNGVYR